MSSDKKQEYSNQINGYLHIQQNRSTFTTDIEKEIKNIENEKSIEYKKQYLRILSLMISFLAAILTMVTFLIDNTFLTFLKGGLNPILIIIVSISTISISFLLLYIELILKNSRRGRKPKKDR